MLQTVHATWRCIESEDIATPDSLVKFIVAPEEWISAALTAWGSINPNGPLRRLWHTCMSKSAMQLVLSDNSSLQALQSSAHLPLRR